jgi:hypothetical protein
MVSVNAHPRMCRGRLLSVIAVMALLAGVFGIWPSGALGAPACDVSTLITAFNNANANPTGTTFASLQAGCTYTLSGGTLYTDSDSAKSGLPELTGGLVLVGNGATVERQSGDAVPNFRIISVAANGRLTLLGVTIQNGSMPGGAGGAIANSGQLTLSDSTVIGNSASGGFGGAIISTGVTRIQRSRVTGNSASIGAGVVNVGGTLTIQSSTIDGNSADFGPGGIYNVAADSPATTNLIDSTVAGNTALGGAGVTNTSIFNAYNSTIAENSDQGLSNQGGSPDAPATSTLVNTIIAENAGGDCDVSQTASGGIVDNGHNLDSDGTCGLSIATLSLPSTNPLFATVGLADNGGPTPTLALAAGSPAIDAGDDVVCAADPVN